MPRSPLWRAVDVAERALSTQLDDAVRSDVFGTALGVALKVDAGVRRRVERTSRRALHLVNLPAAGDVAALRRQLADVDRELRAVRLELERVGGC